MDRPRIPVDFNELVAPDLVLLSKKDAKKDSNGNEVHFREGLRVYVFEMDYDDDGQPVELVANGVAELNTPMVNGNWTKEVKWCCRIDGDGIYHLPSNTLK